MEITKSQLNELKNTVMFLDEILRDADLQSKRILQTIEKVEAVVNEIGEKENG